LNHEGGSERVKTVREWILEFSWRPSPMVGYFARRGFSDADARDALQNFLERCWVREPTKLDWPISEGVFLAWVLGQAKEVRRTESSHLSKLAANGPMGAVVHSMATTPRLATALADTRAEIRELHAIRTAIRAALGDRTLYRVAVLRAKMTPYADIAEEFHATAVAVRQWVCTFIRPCVLRVVDDLAAKWGGKTPMLELVAELAQGRRSPDGNSPVGAPRPRAAAA
jgi:hypothetical protein